MAAKKKYRVIDYEAVFVFSNPGVVQVSSDDVVKTNKAKQQIDILGEIRKRILER